MNQSGTGKSANTNNENVVISFNRDSMKDGRITIYEDGKPKYAVIDIEDGDFELTDDEKIDVAASRVLKRNLGAFKELANNGP